ncbi:MAG: IS5 family transposase [Actinomycetota bacterium]|nr:IS5 family transposase [Actinomycetota bacterium]
MGLVSKDDGWRIPDETWERMEPLLPPRPAHPLGCHNPRVPDREAMNAILLVLRTGMQWNALSAGGICSSSSAHRRFSEWTQAGVFEEFWRQGLIAYDERHGIQWEWLSCDGLMGKAPLGGEETGPNPTDRAKKGEKRSLLCDGRGTPLGLEIAGANVNDFKLLRSTLESIVVHRPDASAEAQGICLDKGYDYPEVYELLGEYGLIAHVRSRGEEKKQLEQDAGFRARRWVVERTHSWLNRFRGLLIRWSKKPENHRALLQLACGLIAWRLASAEGLAG